ncbi:MAG: NAD kinase [Brumimicrobium sp.]
MNVAIYTRKILKHEVEFFKKFFKHLEDLNWNPIIESSFRNQLIKKLGIGANCETFDSFKDFKTGIDLAISIGGDGTFLKTVSYIRSSGVPIIGINTGRLGFLANTSTEDFEKTLDRVHKKDFEFQKRSLLRVETEQNIFGENNLALNELAVHKKDTASMITVHASLDDKYLNSYWADGLIVGTPTGSTAYSLSCGGPIITPGCAVHILTPIAPHNLNVRPVVVPDHMPIKLTVEGREKKYLLTLDAFSKSVKNGAEVMVYKADFMINVIKFEENNFLDTIRKKMMWGIDQRNE